MQSQISCHQVEVGGRYMQGFKNLDGIVHATSYVNETNWPVGGQTKRLLGDM